MSCKHLLLLLISAIALTAFGVPRVEENCPKLAVSANHRFLTAGGRPFFWLGDTGWLLLEKLNKAETGQYLEDRRQKGFNVIQIMLLHTLAACNSEGDSALVGKSPATPKLSPQQVDGTPGTNGYWEHLDFVADLAAKKGIYLALVPIWGPNVRAGLVKTKQAEIYARFLAQRYKHRPNILWMNGGDVRGDDSTRLWNTIGQTLKREDPNHLVTFHPFGRTQSSKWFQSESWLDFNMFQSGHRSYEQDTAKLDLRYGEDNWRYVQSDYNQKPVKPTLDGEPSYEGMPHGLHDTLQPRWKDDDLRRYAYWSLFAGACGFTYGNNAVMQMHKKGEKTGSYGARESWQEAIKSPGAGQMSYLKNLMLQYHFETMVPDQSVLSDPGARYDHLSALRGKNCLLVHTWNGRKIVLNKEQLPGNQFSVVWFSPRNGMSMNMGSVKKGDKFEFTPPGEQANGNDWVLILLRYNLTNNTATQLSIPRDTSYTPYQTWLKIKKEFPQAKIVTPNLPAGLIAHRGVVYATLPETPYGKRELHLDVFRPSGQGKYPALLLLHGGGWRSGNRVMQIPLAQMIASHGFVTATVEYRLSPEAIYPAAVYDTKAAIRFMRLHARKYGIDPGKMAISGSSAGGQLAALVGMTNGVQKFEGDGGNSAISSGVQAIIDMDGVLDFRDPNESSKDLDPLKPSAGAYWFGGSFKQIPGKWLEASPIVYADKSSPPILFINSALPRFHAGRDSVITILNKYGIYSEVHTIQDTPHPFWLFTPWFEPTVDWMVAFLDKIFKTNH